MRLAVTVVSPAAGRQADVVIDADPATPVAEAAAEIGRVLHGEAAEPAGAAGAAAGALFVGYHRVPGDLRLGDSPVIDGCVVSIGDPAGCRPPEPAGIAELRVAGGPAAGTLHRLGAGEIDVGGRVPGEALIAGAPDIVIEDPAIPPAALRIYIDPAG